MWAKVVCIFTALLLLYAGSYCFNEELVEEQHEGEDVRSNTTNTTKHLDQIQPEIHDIPMLEIFPTFQVVQSEKPTDEENDSTSEAILPPPYTRRRTFLEIVTEKYHGFTWADIKSSAPGKPESICLPRNFTGDQSTLEVQLVNSTTLLEILGNKSDTLEHCSVVLFFAPWCMFCSKIAPYYNALARAFPQLNVLAIEASQFSSLNTRYGTIAVPNMLVFFNNSKGVARFNHTERSFETFIGFVHNVTGFKADNSVEVTTVDFEGPLKSTWSRDNDWLLWLSWIFVIVFFITAFVKSSIGQNVINMVLNFGVEHHQHID